MNVPDVVQQRKEWIKNISEKGADKLVFLDESGVNINMTRHYGRAVGKERAVDKAPVKKPTNTTILSSIKLRKGDIVIMDNMRSHHVKKVAEVLNKAKIHLLYLPPYSPDLNPIEKMWSKLKAILRKLKERKIELLPDAIKNAFTSISQSDCVGWFKSCFVCC